MRTIQYQVLRYIPNRVSGEFANLGVIAFDAERRSLQSKFITRIGNLSAFFINLNSRYIIKCIQTIQTEISNLIDKLNSEFKFESIENLEQITLRILPKDDSALVFSEMKYILDIDVMASTSDLFDQFVNIHFREDDDEEVRRDKEVWAKIYKKHFDENGISPMLTQHSIKTAHDELQFDKACKNGVWNCFESVSFNLTRTDTIKNKVYKWAGKLDELASSKENIHLYLLSALPGEHPELNNFIYKVLQEKSNNQIKVDVVSEEQISELTNKIKFDMSGHK